MDRKGLDGSRRRHGQRRSGRRAPAPAGHERVRSAEDARALIDAGHRPDAARVAALQRSAGNQAVEGLVRTNVPSPGGPVVQRDPPATTVAPSAEQAAVGKIVDTWSDIAKMFVALRDTGRLTLDSAQAVKPTSKRLRKARTTFEAAVADLDAELVGSYQQAVVAKLALDKGEDIGAVTVPQLQAAVTTALTGIVRGCMDTAKQAHALGDATNAGVFTTLAKDAKKAGGLLPAAGGTAKEGISHKGRLATVTGYADTANNAGPGVFGGFIGGGEALSAPISAASSGFGGAFGGLGVLFGTIGVVMGIKAAVLGSRSEKELKALDGSLSSDELRGAAAYAGHKKRKKKLGGGASASAGGIAVIAGSFGIAAAVLASIATLGIAAAVFGIVAAGIGLAFVIGKWRHREAKRSAYAKGLAEELIAIAKDNSDPDAKARAIDELDDRGFLVTALGKADEEARQLPALTANLKKEGHSRRGDIAKTIYRGLRSDDVAEQIDAERIIEALHLKPEKIRQLEPDAATSAIAGKMASW